METELERLIVRLVGDGSAYQQMLSMAETATRRFVSTTASVLGTAGLSFGLLATAIKGVQAAARSEQTMIDLETFMGSAEVAKKTLADLAAYSERTPLRMSSLVDATKMLTQMGLEAADVVPMMKLLGNAAGGNSEKLQTMALIMGRVVSQHRITGHEVRMLTMAGFNPMKDMAAATGKSVEELTAQMHRGGIGADLLIRAFQHASEAGGTFAGRSEKQATSLLGLYSTMQDQISKIIKSIGETIVEGLNLKGAESNITEMARMIVGWLKSITPEAKRVVGIVMSVAASIGVVSFAVFALGPVFSLLGTALGPVVSLLGVIPALFAFMLTPVGAVTAAIAGLYAVTMYYAGGGGLLMDWFGKQFEALKEHVKPAIEGIKNALKAGDIQLAFDILWVQIKLSFAEGIRPLRKAWEDYAYFFKHVWEEATFATEKAWNTRTNNMAQNITSIMQKLGYYTEEQGNTMRDLLAGDLKTDLDKLQKEHDKTVRANLDTYNKNVKNITDDLAELNKQQKELTDKAKTEAAKDHPMPVTPKLDPNKFKAPDQKMKVTPVVHWEAALAEGAEALSRMMQYQAGLMGTGPGLGATHSPGGGPGGLNPSPVGGAGGDEGEGSDRMIDLLGEIAGNTGKAADKPGINVHEAGL